MAKGLELIRDEWVSFDGARFHLSVKSDTRFIYAELVGNSAAASARAPFFAAATDQSCTFNLIGLEPGHYRIALYSGGPDPEPFGQRLAARFRAAAGLSKNSSPARHVKLVSAELENGVLAWLGTDSVRAQAFLRLSPVDDMDAYLAELNAAKRSSAATLKFSIISPVFQVEKYLDDFFRSMTAQSVGFRTALELIMIDDGSTDRSAQIIKRWQRKFPQNILYQHKENGGPGSARNVGLDMASHSWLTFIDPDNFVEDTYFETVAEAIGSHRDLAMVSCNVIIFKETTREKANNHSLRFRFATGERALPANALGQNLQLNTSSAFFRHDIIKAHNLRFDERIRPGFEDAHFDVRYLLASGAARVLFLPSAIHYSRERADHSSLKQTGPLDPQRYDAQVEFGYIGLLCHVQNTVGFIPEQVQQTVLYSLHWQIEQIAERPESVTFLSVAEKDAYAALLRQVFHFIDREVIENYSITILEQRHRVGILSFFKNMRPETLKVEARRVDRQQGLIELVFWSGDRAADDTVEISGHPTEPVFRKTRRFDFLGRDFVWEHIRWVPISDGVVRIWLDGVPLSIIANGVDCGAQPTFAALQQRLAPALPKPFEQPDLVRQVRQLATSAEAVQKFRHAWLFMDRDTAADDSAEFMYFHVAKHRPDLNAFFILQRDCSHWARLEREGARLIPFGDVEHALALLNADHLISSHAAHYVLEHLPRRHFGDQLKYRFTYLRHGVSKDINGWLNETEIDCLIASAEPEYQAIVADGSEYRFCAREVALTGLARHDVLLEHSKAKDDRVVVIMPTWRRSLTGNALGAGNRRSVSADFYESKFATRWKALLHSPRLQTIARDSSHSVVFILHENIEQYRDYFDAPRYVEVRSFGDGGTIQPLFANLSVFVTDYSSKAFDVALLERPVLYYQFDRELFFAGGHTSRPGYFDYGRDGFGPIHEHQDSLLEDLDRIINARGTPEAVYRERAAKFFPFRDGRNRERILDAILAAARTKTTNTAPDGLP